MSRGTATNFTGPLAFTFGTAPTDLFKKEDLQILAAAVDACDHSPGFGKAISGSSLIAGSITPDKLAPGAVSNQAVGGDLRGTVANAQHYIQANSGIYMTNAGVDHPILTLGGEQLFYAATGGQFRWVNQSNTVQLMLLDTAGSLSVGNSLNVAANATVSGQITSSQRITSGADLFVANGQLILNDAVIVRLAADQIRVPTTVYFGSGVNDTFLQRNGTNSMQMSGNFGATNVFVSTLLGTGSFSVANDAVINGKLQMNGDLNIAAPRTLTLGPASGGASLSPGTNIGRSADTLYINQHAYVFFDLGVGHIVTCQSLVQTSDPQLKAGATVMTDTTCMSRVRQAVPVYSYQLAPPDPVPPGPPTPTPTPTDIGFMATDIYTHSPEFAATDAGGTAVGVNYANMAAMLWGALRDLDKRCTTFGIPA